MQAMHTKAHGGCEIHRGGLAHAPTQRSLGRGGGCTSVRLLRAEMVRCGQLPRQHMRMASSLPNACAAECVPRPQRQPAAGDGVPGVVWRAPPCRDPCCLLPSHPDHLTVPTIKPQGGACDVGQRLARVDVLDHSLLHAAEVLVPLLEHGLQAVGQAHRHVGRRVLVTDPALLPGCAAGAVASRSRLDG